jgi:hypothetical protein
MPGSSRKCFAHARIDAPVLPAETIARRVLHATARTDDERGVAPLDRLARLLRHADRLPAVEDRDVLRVVRHALQDRLDAALVADQQAFDVGREGNLGHSLDDRVGGVVAAHGVDGDGRHATPAPAPGARVARARRRGT